LTLQDISRKFPIGQPVRFFPVAGETYFETSAVRSEPWELSHGAVVVKIFGRRSGVLTTPEHLVPIGDTVETQVERAVSLSKHGLQPREIAQILKIKNQTARVYLTRARKAGASVPYASNTRSPALEYPLRTALQPHASKRGLTPRQLAERILETVISSDLIDAVLDDQGGANA